MTFFLFAGEHKPYFEPKEPKADEHHQQVLVQHPPDTNDAGEGGGKVVNEQVAAPKLQVSHCRHMLSDH